MELFVRVLFLAAAIHFGESIQGVTMLKLSDGTEIPAIGLGTYLGFGPEGVTKPKDKNLRDIVMAAIDTGYRHIDTASIYATEEEVGEGVRKKIEEGVVKREDIFVTTKLWNNRHNREEVTRSLRESLEKMGLDYVDLFLIHWPLSTTDDYTPTDVDYMETWRGMEDVLNLGLTKHIGLSNFNKEQILRVIKEGTVKPEVLQIEVHPQLVQEDLVTFAQNHSLVVMGYSPFGSLVMRHGQDFPGPKIDDPILVKIATKYGKTTPQVVLRWLVDRNIVPIPKTMKKKRLEENLNIFDFKLEKDEIEQINSFNSNTRYTRPSFWQDHPYYPFEKVENPIENSFSFVKGKNE